MDRTRRTTHRIVIAAPAVATQFNAWIDRHPGIHPEAGGDKTFTVPLFLTTDPDDSTPRAYVCGWDLHPAKWSAIADRVTDRGLSVNDPNTGVIAHYRSVNWTLADALADTTRKRFALRTALDTDP